MNKWRRSGPIKDQLSLLPEPLEHRHPEPPPPPPGPIRSLQHQAEDAGWVPGNSGSCLYVSAGADTRPLAYLRPEVIPRGVIPEEALPRFFVFVDRDRPSPDETMLLNFEDNRSRIETIEHQDAGVGHWELASLLRVNVQSDSLPDRESVVLRIRGDNEGICEDALAEGWAPEWFIGVRDGCGGCFNIIDSVEGSIPLRLGVRFWLTDNLGGYRLTDDNWHRLHEFGHSIPVAGGQRLVELLSWRRWPSSGYRVERWVSVFGVEGRQGYEARWPSS